MCEWCEDRDTPLTGHSNGGVDTPSQSDVDQEHQVGKKNGKNCFLKRNVELGKQCVKT